MSDNRPGGAPPDRMALLVQFLLSCKFRDPRAGTFALLAAFPGTTIEELAQAEVLASEVVRCRVSSGDEQEDAE